jgi:phosphoglucosamine mutase
MISASHNPFDDNGIKFFASDGYKLPDETEREIEALIDADLSAYRAKPGALGRAKRIEGVEERYVESVKNTLAKSVNFEGLKVVIDCANGAAHEVAPWALSELGAQVFSIGVTPNGTNINDRCGSTYPRMAAAKVLIEEADIGIALDGDADRVILIDEKGQIVDGDQVLALIATAWKEEKRLKNGVVATVMSNLGLERYVTETLKVPFERTQVGDRYVNEQMRSHDHNLGGEQSGHIICSDYSTTGDGLIAALQALAVLKKKGRKASEVFHLFNPVPQVIEKFSTSRNKELLQHEGVQEVIKGWHERLGTTGRLLVRASGTEPVIRVMVEGDDRSRIDEVKDDVLRVLKEVAG